MQTSSIFAYHYKAITLKRERTSTTLGLFCSFFFLWIYLWVPKASSKSSKPLKLRKVWPFEHHNFVTRRVKERQDENCEDGRKGLLQGLLNSWKDYWRAYHASLGFSVCASSFHLEIFWNINLLDVKNPCRFCGMCSAPGFCPRLGDLPQGMMCTGLSVNANV